MEAPESPPACNFPEILARDLEISEATFLAKSMTAGAPIRSLATRPAEMQKQPLYLSIDDQNSRVHWGDAMSKDGGLGVIEETSYHSDSSDNGTTPSDVASLTSDSGTDSVPDMEPPSVRMRQPSVCTAATSVMAHCLPAKEQPGYSSVALEDSYQGQSWIDLDMEDSDDGDEDIEAQTAYPGRATKHTPHWDSAATTLASQASEFQHEIITSETYRASKKPSRYQARMFGRSSGGAAPERPLSGVSIAEHDAPTQNEAMNDHLSHDENPAGDLSYDSSIVANERMSRVKIPAHLLEEIMQGSQSEPAATPSAGPVAAQASQDTAAQASPDPPTPAESSDSGDSSIVETFFRSKIALPDAGASSSKGSPEDQTTSPSAKAPVNMRLHPDVFYRLEASVNGFPDTMLSTRALPIDIIRSLPKNRTFSTTFSSTSSSLAVALEQPDAAPTTSSSKWNLSLRKRDNNPPPPPTPSSSHPASSLPTKPTPASIIQRVFPSGNALHCDSLYAHLVAYIYITSLCGPDGFFSGNDPSCMSPPTTALLPATRKSRNLMHRPTRESSSSAAVAIPRKASMLLGMDKGAAPSSSLSAQQQQQPHGLGKVRSLFRGKGKGEEGKMVPAKVGTSGRSRPVTERDVREVQVGLLRCIRNLVAKLRTTAGSGREGEGGGGVLREDDLDVDAEGWKGLDPFLLRALVEIVRGEEERLVGGVLA
ncbi:hypothetical protein NKR19_g2370 [Coniochaeta hoffmannii]|uniref:Uncharacterized protein n=1 Tax=Coniochaeta hoffmannii TaxID=91930 RepID=A0AA38SAM2_9PEZI|nr:hypothetical protein NKR19_g2370 [Coniochaeta hoffmannii]